MGYQRLRVRHHGTHVHVIKDGQLVFDLPWEGALAFSKALHVQGKLAEADAKVD